MVAEIFYKFYRLICLLCVKIKLLLLQPVYDNAINSFYPFPYYNLAAFYLCVILCYVISIWCYNYSSLNASSLDFLRFCAGTSSTNCLMIAA